MNAPVGAASATASDTPFAGTRLGLVGLMLLLFSQFSLAGPIHPPLQALRNGHFTLVSGLPGGYDAQSQTLTVTALEFLRGPVELSGEVGIVISAEIVQQLREDQRYLFVYSDVRRHALQARRFVRTERKAIVHTDGADPAVFPDTPSFRALLDESHREIEQQADYAKVVRRGLRQRDPKLVDLWLAEYVHRPATFRQPSRSDQRQFRHIVRDERQMPGARARILLATIDRGEEWTGDWVAATAAALLADRSPVSSAVLGRDRPLVHAALLVLEQLPSAENQSMLIDWLGADDAIAELAANALAAIGPEAEREGLQQALAKGSTPIETERMIRRRLARLSG